MIELSLKVPDLIPNQYFPLVWLGRANNTNPGYDVVDSNVSLPAFVVRPSNEQELRCGLVSLTYEVKKSGTPSQNATMEVG
jgi:hypothetical protein